ncbi:MAG TPA: hypothetical protein VMR17_19230 [Xanthobacteraceae bacterium]|nr:hypothetical protein [Xanthobacteraceae bacterium]
MFRHLGLSLLITLAAASHAMAQAFPPDGPDIPAVTNTEDASGAYGQDQQQPPPPNAWDKESIWNMKVEGFNDNQGRPIYQPLVVNQDGREILYLGNLAGDLINPLTGKVEPNGTSIIDVTDVSHTKFLFHIPGPPGTVGNAGAQMVRVCSGSVLPHGEKGKWYLLRAYGNVGPDEAHQIWDVTDPAAPKLLTTVVSGLSNTHKSWWECDTGIAYLVAGSKSDGWHQSGSLQHLKIYDLSDPTKPVYIRDFGLVGQQPDADIATAQPCANAPGPNCYEGSKNPPGGIHGPISMGQTVNRVYMPYGVGTDGVIQIVDRQKLLVGCTIATASPHCATDPTQADLLYPQVGFVAMNPENGGHSAMPVLGVPMPEQQAHYADGTPQRKNLLIISSEQTANNCFGQQPREAWILDITNEATPWPMATLNVPPFPGDFCSKGARLGAHAVTEAIYPPYYGKIIGVSWFNAGARLWDIRDPKNPRPIAYYIQAPNANTIASCATVHGVSTCQNAAMNDYVEFDDRGYIYAADRAGSGVTILSLAGDALKVVARAQQNAPR